MAEAPASRTAPPPRGRGQTWGGAQSLFEILDRRVKTPDYLPDEEQIPQHLANAQN